MSRTSVGLAIGAATVVLGLGLLVQTARPTIAAPPIVSMEESARAMELAGQTMERHGTAMIERGRAIGAADLVGHGEHWKLDGQRATQGGRWMAMNPLAPGSLVSSPTELATAGSWGSLTATAQAMLHDPSGARAVDLEALRWNGLAMRSEGAAMADHGRVMAEEVDVMMRLSDHGLDAATADELRGAATSIERAGRGLEQNGQTMIDHADRVRRSLGYR
jgi:hypothetical protein